VLDRYNILFIADEVQSGFGRTGKMFAIEHYGVEPDILVTAKGIADGFPVGAFTTRDEIASSFQPGDHLSTFGGNPVCCAAALANIEVLEREHLCEKAQQHGEYITNALKILQTNFPIIGDVRGLGLMIGMEMVGGDDLKPAPTHAEAIRKSCFNRGVLVGVGGIYGNVVRIQPPLVIRKDQIDSLLEAVTEAVTELALATETAV